MRRGAVLLVFLLGVAGRSLTPRSLMPGRDMHIAQDPSEVVTPDEFQFNIAQTSEGDGDDADGASATITDDVPAGGSLTPEQTGKGAPEATVADDPVLEPRGTYRKTSSTVYFDMVSDKSKSGPGALRCDAVGHKIAANFGMTIRNKFGDLLAEITNEPSTLSEYLDTPYDISVYKLSSALCVVVENRGVGWNVPSVSDLSFKAHVAAKEPHVVNLRSKDFSVEGSFDVWGRSHKQTVSMALGLQPMEDSSILIPNGPKLVVSDDALRMSVVSPNIGQPFTDQANIAKMELLFPLERDAPLVPQVVAREPFALRLLMPRVVNHFKINRYTVQFCAAGAPSYSVPITAEPGQEFVVNDLAPASVYLFKVVAYQEGAEPAVWDFEDSTTRYVDNFALPTFQLVGTPQIYVTTDPTSIVCRVPARRSKVAKDTDRTVVTVRGMKMGDVIKSETLRGPGDHEIRGLPKLPYIVEMNVYDEAGGMYSVRKVVKFTFSGPSTRKAVDPFCEPTTSRRDDDSVYIRVCKRRSAIAPEFKRVSATIRSATTKRLLKGPLNLSIGKEIVVDGVDTNQGLEVVYSGTDANQFPLTLTEIIRAPPDYGKEPPPAPQPPFATVSPQEVQVYVVGKKGALESPLKTCSITIRDAVSSKLLEAEDVSRPRKALYRIPMSVRFVRIDLKTTYMDDSEVRSSQTFKMPGTNTLLPMPDFGSPELRILDDNRVSIKIPNTVEGVSAAELTIKSPGGGTVSSASGTVGDYILAYSSDEDIVTIKTKGTNGLWKQREYKFHPQGFEPLEASAGAPPMLLPNDQEGKITLRLKSKPVTGAGSTTMEFPVDPLVIKCPPVSHNRTNSTNVTICYDRVIQPPPTRITVKGTGDFEVDVPSGSSGTMSVLFGDETLSFVLNNTGDRIGLSEMPSDGAPTVHAYGETGVLVRIPPNDVKPISSASISIINHDGTVAQDVEAQAGQDNVLGGIDTESQFSVKVSRTYEDGTVAQSLTTYFVPGAALLPRLPESSRPIVVPMSESSVAVRFPLYNEDRLCLHGKIVVTKGRSVTEVHPMIPCGSDFIVNDLGAAEYSFAITVSFADGLSQAYNEELSIADPEIVQKNCDGCAYPMPSRGPAQMYLLSPTRLYIQVPKQFDSAMNGVTTVRSVTARIKSMDGTALSSATLDEFPIDKFIALPSGHDEFIVDLSVLCEDGSTESYSQRYFTWLHGLQPSTDTGPPTMIPLANPPRLVLRVPMYLTNELKQSDLGVRHVDFILVNPETGDEMKIKVPAGSDYVVDASGDYDVTAEVDLLMGVKFTAFKSRPFSSGGVSLQPIQPVGSVTVISRSPGSVLIRVPPFNSGGDKIAHESVTVLARGKKISNTNFEKYGQFYFEGAGDHSVVGMPPALSYYIDTTVVDSKDKYRQEYLVKSPIRLLHREIGDPEVYASSAHNISLWLPAGTGLAEVVTDVTELASGDIIHSSTYNSSKSMYSISVPSGTDLRVSMHATWDDGKTKHIVEDLTTPMDKWDNINRELPSVIGSGSKSVAVYIPDRRGVKRVKTVSVVVAVKETGKVIKSKTVDDPKAGVMQVRGLPPGYEVKVTVASTTLDGRKFFVTKNVVLHKLDMEAEAPPGTSPALVTIKEPSEVNLKLPNPLPKDLVDTEAYVLNLKDSSVVNGTLDNETMVYNISGLHDKTPYQLFVIYKFPGVGNAKAVCAWVATPPANISSKPMPFKVTSTEIMIALPQIVDNIYKIYRIEENEKGAVVSIRMVYRGVGQPSRIGTNAYVARSLVPGRKYTFRVVSTALSETTIFEVFTDRKFGDCARNGWNDTPEAPAGKSGKNGLIPAIPKAPIVTPSGSGFKVSWTKLKPEEPFPVHTYVVEKKVVGPNGQETAGQIFELAAVTTSDDSSVTITDDILPGYTYQFTVAALNDVMDGTPSDPTSATSNPANPMKVTKPVFTDVTRSSAKASWVPPYDGGRPIKEYHVECNLPQNQGENTYACEQDKKFTSLWSGKSDTAFLTKLYPATNYTCRVKVVTSKGSQESEVASFTTLADVPDKVMNVTLLKSSISTLIVQFDKPPHNGLPIMYYKVQMAEYPLIMRNFRTVCDFLIEPQCSVDQLQQDSQYVFRVAAINAKGQGEYSNELVVSTARESILAPSFFEASAISKNSMTLRWKPNEKGSARHIVECGSPKYCEENQFNPSDTNACENWETDNQNDHEAYHCCDLPPASEHSQYEQQELIDWFYAASFWKFLITHDDASVRNTCSQEVFYKKCIDANGEYNPTGSFYKQACKHCKVCVHQAEGVPTTAGKTVGSCDWALSDQPALVDYMVELYSGPDTQIEFDDLKPSTAYKCRIHTVDGNLTSPYAVGGQGKPYSVFRTASDFPEAPTGLSGSLRSEHHFEFPCTDVADWQLTNYNGESGSAVAAEAEALRCAPEFGKEHSIRVQIATGSLIAHRTVSVPLDEEIEFSGDIFTDNVLCDSLFPEVCSGGVAICPGVASDSVNFTNCQVHKNANTGSWENFTVAYMATSTEATIYLFSVADSTSKTFVPTFYTNLTVTAGDKRPYVAWHAAKGNGLPVLGYKVEAKIMPMVGLSAETDFNTTTVWHTVHFGQEALYNPEEVLPNREHRYRVSTVTALGESSISTVVDAGNSTGGSGYKGYVSMTTSHGAARTPYLQVLSSNPLSVVCISPPNDPANKAHLTPEYSVMNNGTWTVMSSDGILNSTGESFTLNAWTADSFRCRMKHEQFDLSSAWSDTVSVGGFLYDPPAGTASTPPLSVSVSNSNEATYDATITIEGVPAEVTRIRILIDGRLTGMDDFFKCAGTATTRMCKVEDTTIGRTVLQTAPPSVGTVAIKASAKFLGNSYIPSSLLTPGEVFTVKVAAFNPAKGWSSYIGSSDLRGPIAPPTSPQAPSLSADLPGVVSISWMGENGVRQYEVVRKCVAGSCILEEDECLEHNNVTCSENVPQIVCSKSAHEDGAAFVEVDQSTNAQVAHSFFSVTFCKDTTATPSSTYMYSVNATRSGVKVSGSSSQLNVPAGNTQSLNVTVLSASGTTLRLGWNEITDNGEAVSFTARLYCRAGCLHGSYKTSEQVQVTSETEVEFRDLGGGGRVYQVEVMTVVGNVVIEHSQLITLPAALPGPPGPMYFSQKPGALTISWTPTEDIQGGHLVRYKLESSSDNGGTWTTVKSMIDGTSYTAYYLEPLRTLLFRVAVKNFMAEDGCSQPGAVCGWSTWRTSEPVTITSACGNTLGFICSNHGSCIEEKGHCLCDPIWQGPDCMTPVATATAHVVGAGHVLYEDKPVNVYRRGEFAMYDNVYSNEKVHMVFAGYRANRTLPEWHAASKIALKYRDHQISIEASEGGCPILRQDCAVLPSATHKSLFEDDVPLSFEIVEGEDNVAPKDCQHVAIHNSHTGTKIECHMWHQAFMSCHFIFKKWDGMYGLIFDRENQQSSSVDTKFPNVVLSESLFENTVNGQKCSEPMYLELESTVEKIPGAPSQSTTTENAAMSLMGNALNAAAAPLSVTDTEKMKTERSERIKIVNSTNSNVLGARSADCPHRDMVNKNCSVVENSTVHSACIEDLCIAPPPLGAAMTLREVAKRDAAVLARVLGEAQAIMESAVDQSSSMFSTRITSGAAEDPSPSVDRVLGGEWWNKCKKKNMFALLTATDEEKKK